MVSEVDIEVAGGITSARLKAEVALAGGNVAVKTWSALNALTATRNGLKATVADTDGGTHTDPVANNGVGVTVNNAGVFSWSNSPAGWTRVSNNSPISTANTAEAITGTDSTKAMTPAADKAALDNRVTPVENKTGMLTRTGVETVAPAANTGILSQFRFRVGNRVYGTLDAAGFYLRKLRITANTFVDDNNTIPLFSRITAGAVGQFFNQVPREAIDPPNSLRVRIGNRLYATIDTIRGVYPRQLTIPNTAVIDDDLVTPINTRLMSSGLGSYFKKVGPEATEIFRIRFGSRLIGSWTNAGGMKFSQVTLPSNTILEGIDGSLRDNLGGSSGFGTSSNTFIARATLGANSKYQISTQRLSDGKQFIITSNTSSSSRAPQLTSNDNVLFWSDADQRTMYAPAAPSGNITYWPMDPYDIIEAYGDSLTAGAGASGSGAGQGAYPKQLKDRLGAVVSAVNNRGVGGQTSREIAARDGGFPAQFTWPANTIPANGSVNADSWTVSLITNQGPGNLTGTFVSANGQTITGTLAATGFANTGQATGFSFTTTGTGSDFTVTANTPFIPTIGADGRARVKLFVYGRNGAGAGHTIAGDIAASVAWQTAYAPRYLVGALLVGADEIGSGTQTSFANTNSITATTYGARFVDLNAPPTNNEMSIIGYTPDYRIYTNSSNVPTGRTDYADINGLAHGMIQVTANPTAGQTLTIGGNAIQFVASGPTGAQVLIGATTDDTINNLVNYVNTNTVAVGSTAVAANTAAGSYAIFVSNTTGSAGNATTLATTSSNITLINTTYVQGSNLGGTLPSGMRSSAAAGGSDWLHLNNYGYAIWALRFYRAIVSFGWWSTLAVV